MEKRILLSSPTMHGEELEFVHEAFDRNWIAPLGFNCDGFESETIEYINDKDMHAVCLSSGTAALHLAVKLAGVKQGDTVIASDMTFSASINPAAYEKANIVLVDSERETWNMDPQALEVALKKHPEAKAVILVHLYGIPAKMKEIVELCERYDVALIEDAAEALSATYQDKHCGTFGDYNAYSYNGNKIITTSGGGMLVTKTKEDRDKALFWATQAREPFPWYQHEELGYNYRMSNVVAGIGRGQLVHLEEHRDLKEKIYFRYKEGLANLPCTMNPYLEGTRPNFWLSCLLIDEDSTVTPLDILNALNEANIESRPIWKPMHMQPYFSDCEFVALSDNPIDEDIFARGLCLPSDIKMTEEEQDRVIEVIASCFNK